MFLLNMVRLCEQMRVWNIRMRNAESTANHKKYTKCLLSRVSVATNGIFAYFAVKSPGIFDNCEPREIHEQSYCAESKKLRHENLRQNE